MIVERKYNFCAGPAVFPESVLKEAQTAVLEYKNTGMSILSISHRSDDFLSLAKEAKQDLRDLLNIPMDYEILFLHGGASWQAAMIPANFLKKNSFASYVNTGHWSKKALLEAKFFGEVKEVSAGYSAAMSPDLWEIDPRASYCHFTPNETIDGVEFYNFPTREKSNSVFLMADMSSTLLSRPFDIRGLDLIYAGAQKNMGPSGLSVVILNKKLLAHANQNLPTMLAYQVHVEAESIYNTPATFSWYLLGRFLAWIKQEGGLKEMEKRSLEKSNYLYNFIDQSDFYENKIPKLIRSRMNIPFILKKPELDGVFLKEAEMQGLLNLQGHRSTGGMRASLYNAMPQEGVVALVDFMKNFEKKYADAR